MYVGEYSNGKPDGNGQYTWSNGSFYVGEFKSGLKHGKGKWRRSKDNNTNQYEGEYKNDKKNGFGEFTWASGNTYKGSYKDDEREGFGIMRWTDGSNYEGDWVRGIQHGKGKMSFPDGSLKQGYFENNIFKGDNPVVAKGKNSPKNKNFKKSSSNLSEGRSSKFEKGYSSGRKNGKNSSNAFNNTGKMKKHLIIRQHSSSSKDRITKNQLNNSNPNTGYINENGSHSTLPAAIIRKPGGAKKSTSDKNSSFDENTPTSPYLNPEKEYMLSCIANGGKIETENVNNPKSKTSFGINDKEVNYNTNQTSIKKVPTNSKLEPLFSQSNGEGDRNKHLANNNSSNNIISPKARSHYGKFPGKTKRKIETIKNSRGGSGDRSRESKAKSRLSPLQNKPRKKVPKNK